MSRRLQPLQGRQSSEPSEKVIAVQAMLAGYDVGFAKGIAIAAATETLASHHIIERSV
jgi:hypothetical protein